MRKFSTWLGIVCLVCCMLVGTAVAQDAGADGTKTDGNANVATAKSIDLTKMDAVESYRYFVDLLRACGNTEESDIDPVGTCDKDAIWEMIDKQSKLVFVYAFYSLQRVDRIIETYFDPIDHKQLRERTGTNILKDENITDPQALFRYIFKPEKLIFNENTNSGIAFKSEEKDKDNPYVVIIHTFMENQDFVMIRESDNVWRNAGLVNIFSAAVAPILENEKNMKEFAKDNLLAEINRRKEVLDYFLLERAIAEARAAEKK